MCERESENAEREKQQKTLQKSLHKGFKRKQKKTFVALLPPSGQAYRPTPQGNQTLDIIKKKKKEKGEEINPLQMDNIKIHCPHGYQKTQIIYSGNAANASLQSEIKHTKPI